MDILHLQRQKGQVTSRTFFSDLMRKKTEEINQNPPLYRTWIGHIPEVNTLNPAHLEVSFLFLSADWQKEHNPAHLEVCFLFPIKSLAERTLQ